MALWSRIFFPVWAGCAGWNRCSRSSRDNRQKSFAVAWLASAATPKLQALLLRPNHLGDRHLDDAVGDRLAVLSSDPFRALAWHCRLRGADSLLCAGAGCRRLD